MSNPIQIVPKIVRWGMRFGAENIKFGKFMGGKRGGKGQTSNSGPSGKKAKRWYYDRALSKRLGKHGLRKQQAVKQAAKNAAAAGK